MQKPLRLKMNLLTYNGIRPTNNPQDAIEIDRKVEESNVTEVSRSQKVVPASTTGMALPLADSASNDYLIILVDQQLTINLNGDSTGIVLNPKIAGYMTPVFLLRGVITSLTVTNSSSTTAANIDFLSVKI